ncbi:MAG: YlxR family protein [Cyanobacteria bacterium P01_A01_bin.105]
MPANHRCCISCRRTAHRSAFLQVVRQYPDQRIVVGKGMGRSAYLCPTHRCLQLAQKKNRLGRALRGPVPPEIYRKLADAISTQPSPKGPN